MKKLSFDMLLPYEMNKISSSNKGEINSEQIHKLKKSIPRIMKNELTKRQLEILDLYFYQNMTIYEISQKLGIHPSTVCRTKNRGLDKIHQILKYINLR